MRKVIALFYVILLIPMALGATGTVGMSIDAPPEVEEEEEVEQEITGQVVNIEEIEKENSFWERIISFFKGLF